MERPIDVWYVADQTLCNFDCSYCVTQPMRRRGGSKMWLFDDGNERYQRILKWFAGLPWRLRIRLGTMGEPFVSTQYLAGAAWLSRQSNVEFVELVTNGSFREEQFRQFAEAADISRISLWISYHPTEIGIERVVAAARYAKSLGAFVVVHGLLFPDTEQAIGQMKELCNKHDLAWDVTAGQNFNQAYPDAQFLVVGADSQPLSEYRDERALQAMLLANQGAAGQPCSAGHDYLYVWANGDVFPCQPYFSNRRDARLGSALDAGFVPALRPGSYSPCEYKGTCGCKEDYFHLKIAHDGLKMGPSLGYYLTPETQGSAVVPVSRLSQKPT